MEGPESAFFNTLPPQQQTPAGAAAAAAAAAAAGGGNTQQQQAQEDEVEENLPSTIQDLIEQPHLDNDKEAISAAAPPMVDDDNEPALENQPNPNETVDDIFSGWYHSGICHRRSTICHNAKPELKFWRSADADAEPSNVDLFLGLFFSDFIKTTILLQTSNNLKAGNAQVTFGEFIQWIGLWLLMSTLIGPQRHEFWSTYSIDAFKGSPIRLHPWMSRTRFNEILAALSFTNQRPPAFLDKFWEIRQMIDAWGANMNTSFATGYMNCLDESMSVWTNMFTCPGFMFVPQKPWPFGNEYHTVCCCTCGIMWGIELVEGKDRPRQLPRPQYDDLGSTVGLLLRLLTPIFHLGFIVILDSAFCVLKGIIELRKNGVFASALIKKRRYWPKYIHGEEIKDHFKDKKVGETNS